MPREAMSRRDVLKLAGAAVLAGRDETAGAVVVDHQGRTASGDPGRDLAGLRLGHRGGAAEAVPEPTKRVVRVRLPVTAGPVSIRVHPTEILPTARDEPVRVGDRDDVEANALRDVRLVVEEVVENGVGQIDGVRLGSAVLPA